MGTLYEIVEGKRERRQSDRDRLLLSLPVFSTGLRGVIKCYRQKRISNMARLLIRQGRQRRDNEYC
jgi:hypothetical protein